MITETLQIRCSSKPLREPRAWFLPAGSPTEWIAEIGTWDIPHSDVRLLAVPSSRRDLQPIGVLAVVPGERPPIPSMRCHPYGCLARRLYLPVDARLEPAVEESELRRHLVEGRLYVWHPSAGLIGFDSEDVLTLSDLFLPMVPAETNWGAADPGVAYARSLVAIEAVQPLSVEQIVQSGKDDIGSQSDSLSELPPSPEEKPETGSLKSALSAPLRPVAGFLHWITSKAPPTADGETWIDRLRNWAGRVLSPEHQSAREREIARLMNMLQSDPDNGLKYAIPMGGGAGRGIAPPSTVLSTHDVDFRLSSGAGPVDPWYIPPDRLFQLTARYRELAAREIRLGRHRRAAYIYAELLGEMESAAAALKSGGYYREAALIYEERLHRPHDAAACLEEGGLWNEAIERYEKLENFEKCGAIYRRLDQHEQAQAAYRKAAELCCERGDFLRGAKLYDKECRDTETALVCLRRGWPATNQAKDCLEAEFQILGREGRHDEAERRVQELVETPWNTHAVPLLSDVLAEAAGNYPDATVREAAADGTRVIVSRSLVVSRSSALRFEGRRLLQAVEKLAPEDRLLHRDCERYLREVESQRSRRSEIPSRKSTNLQLSRGFQLPAEIVWHRAAASNSYYFAIGYGYGALVLARGDWNSLDATPELISWRSPVLREGEILLAPSPNDSQDVWVQLRGGPPLPPRSFAGTGQQQAVTPPWTTNDTIAIAQAARGVTWTVSGGQTLVLSVYSADHVPIVTRQLRASGENEDWNREIPIHARPEGAFLGLDDRLVFIDGHQGEKEIPLRGRVTGLSGSAPHSRVRIAASLEEGGVVIWKDTTRSRNFGHGLYSPRTTFTVTGKLVAVDENTIEVYALTGSNLSLETSLPSPGEPLSVMPAGRNGFAVLYADGCLNVYRVSD